MFTILKLWEGGSPPGEETEDVIEANPCFDEKEPFWHLQVRVHETVFAELSEQAGREFGFTHGAKKQLSRKVWKAYKSQNT